MEINNSKNISKGDIYTQGGNIRIGDNFFAKSIEYKDLKKSIKKLKKLISVEEDQSERKEYIIELEEEETKLNNFKKEVIQLAEIFQSIKINDISLSKAKVHFKQGEFKEARKILDKSILEKDLKTLLEEKSSLKEKLKKNKEKLTQKSYEIVVLARLTAIDYNTENSFEKYPYIEPHLV